MAADRRLLALLVLLAGCGQARSLVVVSVDAIPPLGGVKALDVQVTLAATGETMAIRFEPPAMFDVPGQGQTLGIEFAASASGTVQLDVIARDPSNAALAEGTGSVALARGKRADVTITLGGAAPLDAGDDGPPADLGGPDLSSTLPVTAQARPANGAYSGSSLAPVGRNTMNPIFSWHTATGGVAPYTYDIQLSSGCTNAAMQGCAFNDASAVVQPGLTALTYQPATSLTKKRWYWRVRACDATTACGDWSRVWYLEVGRTRNDFNGDGYADVVSGDPTAGGGGTVFVYTSAAGSISTSTAFTLASTSHFGIAVTAADLNADGYADLIVSSDLDHKVWVFLGSSGGLSSTAQTNVAGDSATVIGDVDGDGYPELLAVGSAATLYRGSASGLDSTAVSTFTAAFNAAGGDINGDGYADLVLGKNIYFGKAAGLGATPSPSQTFIAPSAEGGSFGQHMAIADVNGDGYGDVFAGGLSMYGYMGTAAGTDLTNKPVVTGSANFSIVANIGDANHDGYDDLVVGCNNLSNTAIVYLGSSTGLGAVSSTLTGANYYASPTAGAGDVNGDGYDDTLVAQRATTNYFFVYLGASGGVPTTATPPGGLTAGDSAFADAIW